MISDSLTNALHTYKQSMWFTHQCFSNPSMYEWCMYPNYVLWRYSTALVLRNGKTDLKQWPYIKELFFLYNTFLPQRICNITKTKSLRKYNSATFNNFSLSHTHKHTCAHTLIHILLYITLWAHSQPLPEMALKSSWPSAQNSCIHNESERMKIVKCYHT